jgi:hypothetical protein
MSQDVLNAQLKHMYAEVIPTKYRGGILVGAGRPSKGLRHCVSERAGPSGKKRCAKYAPGPKGSGRSGGGKYRSCDVISARGPSGKERCVRYVVHGQSARQRSYHEEVSRVARANRVSAAVAAHMIKMGQA